jgi:maltooligosyltrehalose trehalohydrolase
VGYLQDHDQVGNRALGDRLPEITSPRLLDVGAVLLLMAPFTPMLWMGEEWAASTRWPFFTSHPEPQLAAAEGRGRIEEFATFGWDASEMLDPQDPLAFQTAKLNWSELAAAPHRNVLALYRRLIQLRRAEPDLQDVRLSEVTVDYDEAARWLVLHRGRLRIAANFDEGPQVVPGLTGAVILATGEVKAADNGLSLDGQSAAVVRVS